MMSKKQWFVLLCLLVIYLLLGASFFYHIETREEKERKRIELEERRVIEDLLRKHYIPFNNATQNDIFDKLSTYCGKPMHTNMSQIEEPLRWDFYHSLFFVITVVSTIGYGNLAPTTMLGRIFMIFYGLVGIPINGIVMLTLGEFFGRKFTKLYNRWKSDKIYDVTAKLGLIGSIALYLIPGFTFFIFIPSVIIMYFEGWNYDVAVYYSFVTLTTIGFGDYVAGTNHVGWDGYLFLGYKIFLLVWIIIGLGYVVMVLGFISRGMKSKQMHAIEHILAENIKRTPIKFKALKSLIHEIVLMKVKPVYKKRSIFQTPHLVRSVSCPNMFMYDNVNTGIISRKRAFSECTFECAKVDLPRVQSDSDLNLIDKELTFQSDLENRRAGLLLKFANSLGTFEAAQARNSCVGINCFDDSEILASEQYGSQFTVRTQSIPNVRRPRSCSEVQLPPPSYYDSNDKTWYGQTASEKFKELQETVNYGRARSKTLPVQQEPLVPQTGILTRLKRLMPRDNLRKEKDMERQEIYTPPTPKRHKAISESQKYLGNTRSGRQSVFSMCEQKEIVETLTEILIELTSSTTPPPPKRKLGTASLTPPMTQSPPRRRNAIRPAFQSRRSSMIPTLPIRTETRRCSLTPSLLTGQTLLVPPMKMRKFSLRPATSTMMTPSPVQRQRMKSYRDQINEEQFRD